MFDSLKTDNITVDYIVNNAGVSGPVTCFANAPLEDFKSTIGIHLTGTFWGLSTGTKGNERRRQNNYNFNFLY